MFKNQTCCIITSVSDIEPKRRSARRTAPPPPVRSSGEITPSKEQRSVTNPVQNNIPVGRQQESMQHTAALMQNVPNSTSEQTKSVSTEASKVDTATKTDSILTSDCATSPMPSPAKTHTSKTENKLVDCRTIPLPHDLGNDLVEEIRRNTGLSYKKSCIAMETVLGQIGVRVPDISELMNRIHGTLQEVNISPF